MNLKSKHTEARAVIIRPSNLVTETIVRGIEDMQRALGGGWLEPISLAGGIMYVDEERLLEEHNVEDLNIIATRLVQMIGLFQPETWILGPAIVVGTPTTVGCDTSVPEKLVSLIHIIEAGVRSRTN